MKVTGNIPGCVGFTEEGEGGDPVISYPSSSRQSKRFTALKEFEDHMITVPSSAPVTNNVP